ncbi:hypothetical protein [Microterricola viridarii]|uniref:Signal transduction histidine kinase n=1 Tax=Microterricola viridarii TaxID=412690 RepID=A0A0X8E4S6_9MICO|nr:hypothetical protein [Microterricola viridarii]AMB59398.1 hypothetical protein AWU67_11605 [Microterricola viridarii]
MRAGHSLPGGPFGVRAAASRRKRAARNSVDVSNLLMLHGVHAPVILVLFLVAQAVLALAGDSNPIGASLIAFVPLAIAAVWVMQPAADPFPAAWCAGILALCTVTVTAQSVQPLSLGAPLYVTWHLGAVTTVLFMLILRGRVVVGWAGFLGMAVGTLVWASASGLGIVAGLDLTVRHAATLVVGTAVYFGLLSTARRITTINRRGVVDAAAAATALASDEERIAQLTRLDEMARPVMERVASGLPMSESERRDCLLIEASLRDVVRGRALASPPVLAAARKARERGVEVTLLDDSGMNGDPSAVAALIENELHGLQVGALTARLQPPGRPELASIMIAPLDGAARILIVGRDGRVR